MYTSSVRYNYEYKNSIGGNFALKLLCRTETQDIYIRSMVGNKVFRKDFLIKNNIKFPSLFLFEDDYFMFLALLYANKISIVPNAYQHYYQRESSAMHTLSKAQIESFIKVFKEIRLILENKGIFEATSLDYYSF